MDPLVPPAFAFRLEDLPFERREPLALLGIDRGRSEPDLSGAFTGFGYTAVDEIVLGGATGEPTVVRDALVLALHSPYLDDPDADPIEFELEFSLPDPDDPTGPPVAVFVSLARFLEVRAAPLVGDAPAIVLTACNPRNLHVAPPRWLDPSRRLHYATGNVVSWLDIEADGRERLRLQAQRWHTVGGPAAR